ncbi:hypothetical protein [uncultured Methanobacterium sp.]|uniref:hypothetical protein n=1 Tax=uncultured Methanobacterium sp. TaxID=176306 RepID=UPI002AA79138|nr:hypothetical protein [uncultured Methanobacterium sp.]
MEFKPKTYTVGDVEVTRISESVLDGFTLASLLPDWNKKSLTNEKNGVSSLISGEPAFLSTHTWLVKTRKHTILLDTGAGNDKEHPFTSYFHHQHHPILKTYIMLGLNRKMLTTF